MMENIDGAVDKIICIAKNIVNPKFPSPSPYFNYRPKLDLAFNNVKPKDRYFVLD